MTLKDNAGRYTHVNPIFRKWFAEDGVTVEGLTANDLYPKHVADAVAAIDRKVFETGEQITQEFEEPFVDGSLHTTLMSKFPIRDKSGTVVSIGSIESDITERKQAEVKLGQAQDEAAEARRRLADAIEHIAEGFVWYDENGKLVLCNPKFKEFWSYSETEAVSGASYEFLDGIDLQREIVLEHDEGFWQRRASFGRETDVMHEIKMADGRWLQIRDRKLPSGGNVSVHTDITELKTAEEALYHRAECLTHVGDSQAVRSLTQCGEPMRFAMAAPIDLRNDFDSVSLRRLAKRTRDATQSRRLLALAEVYDGGSRTDASRIGGVGLQIIRDWVLRFNARGLDGLVDGKSPGAPSKLNADHRRALAEVVEAGPVPAVDGVVRWRRKDLARWLLETFAISLDETTVGRELKALGFAKISARPRHYAQNELAVEAFKKNFPAELAKIRARLPKGVEIELWWQDEARIGQKNKLTRRWARRGTRPRAPRDQRTEWAYIFGAICPAKGKGAGLVMPWCDTDAMAAHLIEISAAVDPGAQAVLIVDQAGWHLTPKLAIPDNITVLALPPRSPELNPVENVWQFMRDNWLSNRIFKSYEDIVALCCQAWNNLIDQPWKIMSLGMRKWAHGF